jgi:hypothetical protein
MSKLTIFGMALILLNSEVGVLEAQTFDFGVKEKASKPHRDALGTPCLAISSEARAHKTNPNVYDQMLIVRNGCSQAIKIHACFVESDRCINKEISGFQRQEIILGVSPMVRFFKYELTEE